MQSLRAGRPETKFIPDRWLHPRKPEKEKHRKRHKKDHPRRNDQRSDLSLIFLFADKKNGDPHKDAISDINEDPSDQQKIHTVKPIQENNSSRKDHRKRIFSFSAGHDGKCHCGHCHHDQNDCHENHEGFAGNLNELFRETIRLKTSFSGVESFGSTLK